LELLALRSNVLRSGIKSAGETAKPNHATSDTDTLLVPGGLA
jgi:hypothetical protein